MNNKIIDDSIQMIIDKEIEIAIREERKRCSDICFDYFDDETMSDLDGDDICKRLSKKIME